jgi:hypothetical protein
MAPKAAAPKQPNPQKTDPKSLIAPSSSATTSKGALSHETTATATQIQQETITSPSRIDAAQVHGKGKRKAPMDSAGWTVEEVAHWLKGEGFNQGICDKFTSATFNFSSNIPHLHIRRTENDVNGKLLLKLNAEGLKSEIGIESWGKRYEIMMLIKGLRSEGQCMAYRAECCWF